MGISLNSLAEGCCDSLNRLSTIDLDAYKSDKSSSSIDRLLECDDKYIFIEEKSFLLDYFRLAGQEARIKFHPINGMIDNLFLETISQLSKEVKEKIMYKSVFEKTFSSSNKVKDTTFLLLQDEQFSNEKVRKSEIIYLYCSINSLPVNKLLSIVFNSKLATRKIVECSKLEKYLKKIECTSKSDIDDRTSKNQM